MTEFRVKGDKIDGLKGLCKDDGTKARLSAVNAMNRKTNGRYEVAVRFGRKLTRQVATMTCVIGGSGEGKELPIGELHYRPAIAYCKENGETFEKR